MLPCQETWRAFMADVEAVANRHPYVVKPGAGRVAGWGGCIAVGAVLGFCCINPDGGDYSVWVPEVQQVLDRWRPTFQQRGCMLTFVQQRYACCVRYCNIVITVVPDSNCYISIDVDPNAPVQQFKKA